MDFKGAHIRDFLLWDYCLHAADYDVNISILTACFMKGVCVHERHLYILFCL